MRSILTRVIVSLLAIALIGVVVTALGAPRSSPLDIRPSLDEGRERLMTLLAAKENALERREATVAAREADIRAAEEAVEKRLEELKTLREELREQLVVLDDEREAEVKGLVRMFESMRDKEAAAVLVELDPLIAVEVLSRMNTSKAGKAMAKMSPAKAAGFAERLGRPALQMENR